MKCLPGMLIVLTPWSLTAAESSFAGGTAALDMLAESTASYLDQDDEGSTDFWAAADIGMDFNLAPIGLAARSVVHVETDAPQDLTLDEAQVRYRFWDRYVIALGRMPAWYGLHWHTAPERWSISDPLVYNQDNVEALGLTREFDNGGVLGLYAADEASVPSVPAPSKEPADLAYGFEWSWQSERWGYATSGYYDVGAATDLEDGNQGDIWLISANLTWGSEIGWQAAGDIAYANSPNAEQSSLLGAVRYHFQAPYSLALVARRQAETWDNDLRSSLGLVDGEYWQTSLTGCWWPDNREDIRFSTELLIEESDIASEDQYGVIFHALALFGHAF